MIEEMPGHSPENELLQARMGIGAHDQQIGPEIVAGSQQARADARSGRPDFADLCSDAVPDEKIGQGLAVERRL
jgi:hypothetical protein